MASSNDSIKKTIIVALSLCLVCSIFVAGAAVGLKPIQQENRDLDRKRNILAAAQMLEPNESIDEVFATVEKRLVNLEAGRFATAEELEQDNVSVDTYIQQDAAKDPDLSKSLKGGNDPASIKRRAKYAVVYLVKDESEKARIILPVHGYGLWSTMYGFVALEDDYSTIVGFGFYQQAETPGLGGEVDNPNWKALWEGKEVYNENNEPVIRLAKGSVDPNEPDAEHKVDGLSGATLTSRGVTNLVQYWFGEESFGPFLTKLRSEGE
ncbi:Na(+)-translocating NADH-quinone reductase subunit C [Marinomonas ostreistagni]|uniref:Na(+)-translocating NADH-quinone reductase subunit C n=1 Tax=Marinomonas ostreistagni TaxID=359209 RepID=UPI00194F8F4B|nr:Na(+)-translocating NADH-quinone reductase subunit C [Marinomonas ostreistagni]MBM6551921.1 Na(+)-translocating NADH-quinone reductase subunit C [Marinomonas ostreistagni]